MANLADADPSDLDPSYSLISGGYDGTKRGIILTAHFLVSNAHGKLTLIMEGMNRYPISSPPFTDSGMSSIVDFLPLLPLAIENEHVVFAERYISGELAPLFALLSLTCPVAVGLAMFVYDYTLTFGDEMQYIWRRPITGIKMLYLILRYGVAIAELVYFQGESLFESVHQAQHSYCTYYDV
jgi:hypothetical protein